MDDTAAVSAQFRIVALVSSVGGLTATSDILGALPADFPAAVLVLQHSDPERFSHLADILAQRSPVAVTHAADGVALRPNTILVVPSGAHCVITRELGVRLIVAGAYPPYRPSADLLLTTLAVAAGPRAVAVVLTGAGTDGATGATAVHAFGGVVIAADEASSENFSMPAATIRRDGITDVVLPVGGIAAFLVALVDATDIAVDRVTS